MNPRIAVLASQQIRGFGIADDGLRCRDPFQCSTIPISPSNPAASGTDRLCHTSPAPEVLQKAGRSISCPKKLWHDFEQTPRNVRWEQ